MTLFTSTEEERIVTQIGKLAGERALPLRIVGGFIRDRLLIAEQRLLTKPKQEIDFVTTGDATGFADWLASRLHGARSFVYGHFGTARVEWRGWALEFATARVESYQSDSRNPVVVPTSFEEDAARRDFTVNALALSITDGKDSAIIDPFNGLEDLRNGVLRTPRDPHITFSDDPLRMLRAARFVAKLGFTVEPNTLQGIRDNAERIRIVHSERIADEFYQLMMAPKPQLGLKLLVDCGVIREILPEVQTLDGVDQKGRHSHKDVLAHTLQVIENAANISDDPVVRFSALFHDIAKPQTKKFLTGTGWTFYGHELLGARMILRIFRRMTLPMKLAERVAAVTRLHMRPVRLSQEGVTDSAVRRLRVEAGEDIDALLKLCRADITSANPQRVKQYLGNYNVMLERLDVVEKRDHLREFQSPVRGEEIAELFGISPGPRIGMLKTAVEEAILDGDIPNEYDAARDWLLAHKAELMAIPEQRARRKSLEQLDEEQLSRLLQSAKEEDEHGT